MTRRRLHRPRRPAQRRQVDAGQRDRRQPRSRSSRCGRRRRGGRSAASPPTSRPAASSSSSTCPACSARATCSPSGCSSRVERELADSDVALLVVNGEEGVGPGDRFIARALLGAEREAADDLRGQQGRPARARTSWSPVLADGGRAGGRRRGLPDQRPQRRGPGGAGRAARRAGAGGPLPVPARGPQRPVERGAARRADPRAGAEPHPRGDPALGRGLGQGGRASARTAWSPSAPRSGPRPSRRRGS